MKTKLSFRLLIMFMIIALSPAPCALSQIPQGFNYQAIARDGSGNPISSPIDVKIAILTSESDLDVIWEEEHPGVDPDEHGLFSIVVGDGTTLAGGLSSFSLIDWTETPLYIRTKINDVKLGTTQLWSVPYSMISGDLEGSVKKLEVMGADETSDEALFEVKRKDGELMFGVYNHGVRINMPLDTLSKTRKGGFIIAGFDNVKGVVQDYFVVNPDSIRAYIDTNPIKTRKGGFAVAGFEAGKQTPEEYLRVTRDSTRIYLNDTGTKTRKGGFAVGGFDAAKQDIQDYLLVSPDSVRVFLKETDAKTRKGGFAISGYDNTKGITNDYFNVDIDTNSIIDPSENRILWYPLKNAFLTGKVLIEDKDSVGENSFASGYESKAIGNYSQALGYKAIARSDYSTAIGKNAVADSINSFAFGDSARAKNDESYAIGRGAIAKGYRSFAFGSAGVDSAGKKTDVAKALGDYSFAIGQGSIAQGTGSFAIGLADTTIMSYSVALGYKTRALGYGSTTMGVNTTANGYYSTAMGFHTTAGGHGSTSLGASSSSGGDYSLASGYMCYSDGKSASSLGNSNLAAGDYSTNLGGYNEAMNEGSVALGVSNSNYGKYAITIGYDNSTTKEGAAAIGYNNSSTGFYAVSLGYKNKATGQNSMSIGNMSTASNTNSFASGDSTVSSGIASFSSGFKTKASAFGSGALGYRTIANGNYSVAMGLYTQAISYASLVLGQYNLIAGSPSSWIPTDPLFVIGNGTNTVRANALTVLKNGNIGIGFSVPNAKLHVSGSALFEGGQDPTITPGSGIKMVWYPAKVAFRASINSSTDWNNVGDFSFSAGYYNKATNTGTVALGFQSSATGNMSVALGASAISSGNGSISLGYGTKAIGAMSIAMGSLTVSRGSFSSSMGYYTNARSYNSHVFGRYNDTLCISSSTWNDSDPLFIIGYGSSDTDRKNALTVYKNGKTFIHDTLGIGTSSPEAKLDIIATGDGASLLKLSSDRPWVFQQEGTGTATALRLRSVSLNKFFYIDTDGATCWRSSDGSNTVVKINHSLGRVGIKDASPEVELDVVGDINYTGTITDVSDINLKKDIVQLTNVLDKLMGIRGIEYSFIDTLKYGARRQIGMIAQEVQKVFPALVSEVEEGILGINNIDFNAVLLEAIKEQQRQIESYKSQLQTLQQEVEQIKAILATSGGK